MASIVSICNLALGNLGKDSISDIDEATTEARMCRRFYSPALEALLAVHPWRFAEGRAILAEVENDRPNEWGYAYNKPVDCIAVRSIEQVTTSAGYIPYLEEGSPSVSWAYDYQGGRVYCNLSPVSLVYTKSVSDPSIFPPLFVDALSWHLSARLAVPLTRDQNLRQAASKTAQQASSVASAVDANEARTTSRTGSEYEAVRSDY